MPGLDPTTAREPLHRRSIEIHGYKRDDGLYDVEGHLVDTKRRPVTRARDLDRVRADRDRNRQRAAFRIGALREHAHVDVIVAHGYLALHGYRWRVIPDS